MDHVVKENGVNDMKLPTAKEVSDLRGIEFVYVCDYSNGEILSGEVLDVYVAQADINYGITIMGTIPDHIHDKVDSGLGNRGEDVVIQCCVSNGNINNIKYIEMLHSFIEMINSGVFFSAEDTCNGRPEAKDADAMRDMCAFNNM